MGSNLSMDDLAEQILCELRRAPENSLVGENLVNAMVDAMVQANIDLDSVSLGDVKNLLSHVCRSGRQRTGLCFPATAF